MKEKELYCSPETEVMELKLEGVIAASADADFTSITNPFDGFTELTW